VTSNQFATLGNLNNENESSGRVPPVKCPKPTINHHMERRSTIPSASKIKLVNQKIVIVGDSHGRNRAAELKHRLDPTFAISSFVKPGAGMRAISGTMQADIKKLKR